MLQHEGKPYATRSEYAVHIEASKAYVTKLGHQGRLVEREINGKKLIDVELTDRLVRNTTDMSKARNGANAAPGRAPSAPIVGLTDTSGKADIIYRQAQAQERAYNAKMAELEYKRAIGEVVLAADVESELSRVFATFREAMMQIPSRVAAVVAAEADEAKVHRLIADEIRGALLQLKERA